MALRKNRAAVASSAEVEAVAEELLKKGNAVDAAVAGVFAACALSPGVLLGPVQILVGGGGAGLRAFDGRVRQPGIGAPRPRGFRDGEDIPNGSRVGVPWLPATLSVAVATAGTATFAQVMAPALAMAKGSPRHEALAKIAGRGPRALEERPLSSELLAIAGRPNGGLLTPDDLASPRPEVREAARRHLATADAPRPSRRAAGERSSKPSANRAAEASDEAPPKVVIELPWAREEGGLPAEPAAGASSGTTRAVCAVDRFGSFAVACWDEGIDGVMIEELQLRAPFCAEPVLRGQTRIRPGDARPAAAAIALAGSEIGPEVAFAAFGAGDAYQVLQGAIRSFVEDERIEAHGEARLVAVLHAGDVASVFR